MLSRVGADGRLDIGDSHVQAVHILLCQRLQSRVQALLVQAVVAVAGRSRLRRDGLADGAQVQLQYWWKGIGTSAVYSYAISNQ